ncbi:MAG: hypothetical protein WDO16_06460 [Bacteroidota bacterium]
MVQNATPLSCMRNDTAIIFTVAYRNSIFIFTLYFSQVCCNALVLQKECPHILSGDPKK